MTGDGEAMPEGGELVIPTRQCASLEELRARDRRNYQLWARKVHERSVERKILERPTPR